MLRRLHGMLAYTAEPIQTLLAAMPKDDLKELPWLTRFDGGPCLNVPYLPNAAEREFARSVFQSLGMTDLEGQLTHLEYCAKLAGEYKDEAHSRTARCSRVYLSTGICAGLSLGLLLL